MTPMFRKWTVKKWEKMRAKMVLRVLRKLKLCSLVDILRQVKKITKKLKFSFPSRVWTLHTKKLILKLVMAGELKAAINHLLR